MDNLVLLVIEKVFQQLLFLRLVITLSNQTVSATDLIIAQDGSSDNLLKDELVPLISYLVVNLSES